MVSRSQTKIFHTHTLERNWHWQTFFDRHPRIWKEKALKINDKQL